MSHCVKCRGGLIAGGQLFGYDTKLVGLSSNLDFIDGCNLPTSRKTYFFFIQGFQRSKTASVSRKTYSQKKHNIQNVLLSGAFQLPAGPHRCRSMRDG